MNRYCYKPSTQNNVEKPYRETQQSESSIVAMIVKATPMLMKPTEQIDSKNDLKKKKCDKRPFW